jgi:hypothetical protein
MNTDYTTFNKINKPKINPDHKFKLLGNIDQNLANSINLDLDSFLNNITNINLNDINSITKSINNLLTSAAKITGCFPKLNTSKQNKKITFKKPWFNNICYKLRNKYRNAKNYYKHNNTLYNKNKMLVLSKQYKKQLNSSRKKYYTKLNNKLRYSKSKNPKEFWNILKDKHRADIKADFKDLVNHFKDLNNSDVTTDLPNVPITPNNSINNNFTIDEIQLAINKIKRNKACGIDGIANDFIIDTSDITAPIITKLFNIIINTGIVPDDWGISIITPIFKNNGSADDPSNYRGISILNALSKLFTLVINDRLTCYLDDFGILSENQAGFRKNYTTTDHIFSLKCIIDLYTQFKKKKLFCAFIDYKKAFDTINRNKLWYKLIANGINGKILNVISNLYNKAICCVKDSNGRLSDFFPSLTGVRQGDNLSPLLFSIYLNDLETELCKKYKGLVTISEMIETNIDLDDIVLYLKLTTLLYADDTIIFAESKDELQTALNALDVYCTDWDLSVNVNKTKIMIFSKGKIRNLPQFTFQNNHVDIVFEYKYLGIVFNYNGKFNKAKNTFSIKPLELCIPLSQSQGN